MGSGKGSESRYKEQRLMISSKELVKRIWGLEQMIFIGSFQPKLFDGSVERA